MTTQRVTIEVANLGIQYDLRLSRTRTVRRTLSDWLHFSSNGRVGKFWALRDVSFSVEAGDVLGVIGRNGSGKSTLLLAIAGILRPDAGSVRVDGKVSTLLALGAGFDQDLTGRENIYLNAAFLGLPRRVIDQRIDEIIAFSELDMFVDAPLRTYSSGMRARLGFSIAAHINPDVLLLDEVLGTGDAQFQQKSKQKIQELMDRAKSLVVVSHDLRFVRQSCTKVLWLNQGTVATFGTPEEVVDRYLASSESKAPPPAPVTDKAGLIATASTTTMPYTGE